jgi:hypothetical protein
VGDRLRRCLEIDDWIERAVVHLEINQIREEESMSRKPSPFGMATCSICDEATTHAIRDEDETWLLYCTPCTEMIVREFPELAVVQWWGAQAAPDSSRGADRIPSPARGTVFF